jgi:hypothetical protein
VLVVSFAGEIAVSFSSECNLPMRAFEFAELGRRLEQQDDQDVLC